MPDKSPLIYVYGAVCSRDMVYVTAVREDFEDRNLKHALLMQWKDDEWRRWFIENRLTGISCFDGPHGRAIAAIAQDGEALLRDDRGVQKTQVDAGEEAPSDLRLLRTVRRIGQHLYAAGMRRQVYRCPLSGAPWQRIDDGILVTRDQGEVAGFLAIDGADEKTVHAVGLRGELFTWDGASWTQRHLPTNVGLYGIRCLASGEVYICGDMGTVLSGRGDTWSIVANEATDEAFWGIEVFSDRVYLAADGEGLFTIEDDEVVPVDVPLERTIGSYSLDARDGVLLSVGSSDVLLFDGSRWRDLDPPRT